MNLQCCIVILALSMTSAAMAQDMPWRYDFENEVRVLSGRRG